MVCVLFILLVWHGLGGKSSGSVHLVRRHTSGVTLSKCDELLIRYNTIATEETIKHVVNFVTIDTIPCHSISDRISAHFTNSFGATIFGVVLFFESEDSSLESHSCFVNHHGYTIAQVEAKVKR